MKLLIFTTLFALSSTAHLPSRTYLPQTPISSGITQSQSFQTSQSTIIGGGSSGDTGNRRPQQEIEKNAVIVKQDQEVSESGFHYSYETSNGIRAEEAGNTVQSQGGFSYKGDDGNTYIVTFTAGEGGFRPQGAHLPVAPPTPEAILVALQQNAKDEAAGIFDDGKYKPEIHGGGQSRPGAGQGSITSSSSSSSSLSQIFGSTSHQTSFNPNTGYQY